jgi:hypothetical protein
MGKLEEEVTAIQYGDVDEAEAALESAVKKMTGGDKPQNKEARDPRDPGANPKVIERQHRMDIIAAKHRMDEVRGAAEVGDMGAIRTYFGYRFPKIANDPDLWAEASQEVDWSIQHGASNKSWAPYEKAGRTVLDRRGLDDLPMTEDELLEFDKGVFGDPEEPPNFVEPVPVLVEEGLNPEQAKGRVEAVAELAAMRGKRLGQ